MKRTLIISAIVALGLALGGTARAAGTAVPKTLCLTWSQFPEVSCLTIKAAGTLPAQSGTTKYYAITGDHIIPKTTPVTVPITGTGQVSGTTFHFSYTGAAGFDPGTGAATFILGVEGDYDLVNHTGTVTYHWSLPTDGSRTVTWLDCKTVVIPYGAVAQKE